MDRRLREALQRARASQSPAARDALFEALRRLADLTDRAQWSAAAPWAQDVVLEAIGRWLAPAFTLTGVEAYAVGGVAHRIGSFQHTATRITLHLIPGGWFVQGAANTRASEQPQRRVRIAPLLVARYPTLQVQWDHLGGSDDREWQGALLPIERVSWEEVQRWLTRAGDGLRLPSESEWEYACRAGTSSPYFWGEVMDPRYCWHAGGEAWTTRPPVTHLQAPNAFGLVDMLGNVFEWCEDVFGPYDEAPSDGTPRHPTPPRNWPWSRTPSSRAPRVVRGGDAFSPAFHCRASARNWADPRDRGAGIGFRVVRGL